jgi:protocatechuate 3,4-dioxygenase beta subunit
LALAATAAAVFLLVGAGEQASAADGSISGTVTDEFGAPIAGAWVNAQHVEGCCPAGAVTDSSGDYTISGLSPDNYRLSAAAQGYVLEMYNDTIDFALATPVTVDSGADTPGIDFELSTGGGISGLVTDELGTPLEGILVEASFMTACCSNGNDFTDSDGIYTIDGLAPGSYRVFAFFSASGYSGEYYDDTTDPFSATPVSVVDGFATPDIDFGLSLGGSISGEVRDDVGAPIEGATVDVVSASGCCAFGVTTTAADGTYTVDGLSPGSYIALASATGFKSEYYDDTFDSDLATAVTVVAPADTPDVDFGLLPCTAPWPVAAGDGDCDGFAASIELFVGTDPMVACEDGETPSDWPPDFNGDQTVNVMDLMSGFRDAWGSSGPSGPDYSARFDLNADELININDLLSGFKFAYSKSCAT